MEVLGIVANIAAVIQITAQVTQLSYSYFLILESESTGLLPPRPASLDDEALMGCYEEISRLYYELQKRKSRILRPFQDKELRPNIDMLQQFRENLSEYLSACILVTTNATYQKVSSLSIEQSRNILLTSVAPHPVSIREKPDPCPGTGTWFLKTTELRCWIRGTTQLLWCYGPPGVGKSYLANITKMIAKAGLSQPIYLVLDGVDEMKDPTKLLNCCLELAESGIQVLVTSRKLPHIEKKMKTATQLEIAGSTDDMKLYIGKRLEESDFEDERAQDDAIVERIICKSGGLFLLTQLTLDEVLALTTVGQIKKALKKEALGLQQAFELTLQRIYEQSKARSFLARRLIRWILYAKRRLSIPKIGKWDDPDGERLRSDPRRRRSILLLSAIRDGQLSSVQMLAKSGVNFESVFALHIAAHRKDNRFVRCLLENGADPNQKDYQGRTALHIAILNGFAETMTALAHGGSNVNQYMPVQSKFYDYPRRRLIRKFNTSQKTENKGTPPIVLARGDLQMVHELLLLRADPNLTDENAETVELLCYTKSGPAPSIILFLVNVYNSKKKDHPLNISALHGPFQRILPILHFSGSLINFYGSLRKAGKDGEEHPMSSNRITPLALAAMLSDSRDIFKDLLNYGADLYHEIDVTFDPILTAALFGNQEDLAYLLEQSIASPNTSHWTIHLTSIREHKSPVERVCFCLQKAGVLDRVNVEGKTLLHLATQENNAALRSALVAHGANENFEDQITADVAVIKQDLNSVPSEDPLEDENFLMTAVENGDVDAVSKFLQMGGDPNETIREWIHDIPVLYQAASHGKSEIVSLLLDHGADTEVSDGYGWRPLHIACFRGYTEIVRVLIAKGADVHASTVKWNNANEKPSGLYENKPWTGNALHTATFGGHSEIVEILLKHGVDVHASTGVTAEHLAYPASGPTALHIALSIP
ncbi:hypothetical protein N7493_009936 [Penicillium malachiteum]|uniref:Nephrocystin 3-like N-terminal domain-containing protein n=1 Tax=Penicillium malachiteum TaxID=1324776 RepID=A0AAD6HE80_9EURO|nr:hypothetical protein N7493_009936 [Penicillium malachiteum]